MGGPRLTFVASPSLTRPFFFPNGDHLDGPPVVLAVAAAMAGTTSDDEPAGGVADDVEAAAVGSVESSSVVAAPEVDSSESETSLLTFLTNHECLLGAGVVVSSESEAMSTSSS